MFNVFTFMQATHSLSLFRRVNPVKIIIIIINISTAPYPKALRPFTIRVKKKKTIESH